VYRDEGEQLQAYLFISSFTSRSEYGLLSDVGVRTRRTNILTSLGARAARKRCNSELYLLYHSPEGQLGQNVVTISSTEGTTSQCFCSQCALSTPSRAIESTGAAARYYARSDVCDGWIDVCMYVCVCVCEEGDR
jgi:hypothetical protein